jgi:recombination protein RecA
MKFLDTFKKDLEKTGLRASSAQAPRYWYSTGNHSLNRILSGSFIRGVPQGRVTGLTGPSGSGKSFVLCNIMREAQKDGAIILVLDSENALDDDFVSAIGVNTEENYMYVSVVTISDVVKAVSKFLKQYRDEYGIEEDAPQVLICIDSLDMLITDTELEHFKKGDQKGDQGQKNKQLKAMLRTYVSGIKDLNISMVVTDQVYKNQDIRNGEGVWIIKDAVRYSLSQIALLTKLKLKDGINVTGINMRCHGYKTRFTRPFQTVNIEVPYDTGMDRFNGLLQAAEEMGVTARKGSRWSIKGDEKSFYAKNLTSEQGDRILELCENERDAFLEGNSDEFEELIEAQPTGKSRRSDKMSDLAKNLKED